ncbi:MAG: 50S ribosomal protein L9, partial [Candidatus Staskawiczbacteria bacterium RIFCSPHIGHO2_01_FULL_41_41]
MKVILLQDIENLGKKYEIKDVKPGHARNLLIPQNLVKPATKANLHWLEGQKKIVEEMVTEELKQAQELASKIDGLEVAVTVKIGEDGQLFESISAAKISEKLKEMGFEVKKSQ